MSAGGFLPAAEAELHEAARFYEGRGGGLGHDFLDEVERAIESIVEQPYSGVSTCIMKFVSNAAGNAGANIGAATVRERSAASPNTVDLGLL